MKGVAALNEINFTKKATHRAYGVTVSVAVDGQVIIDCIGNVPPISVVFDEGWELQDDAQWAEKAPTQVASPVGFDVSKSMGEK